MKIVKYLSLVLLALATASCEKHEIEYPADPIPANSAMVQIHYMVPQSSSTAKSIYKIELDGNSYVNNNAALMAVYGSYPGSSKYYTVKAGSSVSLKLYQSSDMNLVYENTISGLEAGKKYQVIVHDFAEAPKVLDCDFSFKDDVATEENMTELTAQYHFINFINMMYEDDGTPYQGTLQYLYQITTDWENSIKSEWLPVGGPVAFGESTGWQKLNLVNNPELVDAAYARVDYRIVDASGNDLEIIKSVAGDGTKKYGTYSDYWTGYAGRHCIHFMRGFRSNTASAAGVTQWIQY